MSVHDVQHYPEIKRLLSIPEDEPIFILRAQDEISVETIAGYSELAAEAGADRNFLDGMASVAMQFADWRASNRDRVKIPD